MTEKRNPAPLAGGNRAISEISTHEDSGNAARIQRIPMGSIQRELCWRAA